MWLFMNKYRDGLWEIKEKVHFNTPFGRGILGWRLVVYSLWSWFTRLAPRGILPLVVVYSACASYGTPFGRM
jgi:hypothetical protein